MSVTILPTIYKGDYVGHLFIDSDSLIRKLMLCGTAEMLVTPSNTFHLDTQTAEIFVHIIIVGMLKATFTLHSDTYKVYSFELFSDSDVKELTKSGQLLKAARQ